MRARESFYGASELERVRAEIRRARRAEMVWTAAAVVVLLALGVLVYWLAGWILDAGFSMLDFRGQQPVSSNQYLVAMAPVMQGSIMGLVAFLLVGLAVLAARKIAEPESTLRERRLTELVDPFSGCTDGLTGDEMHRILTSCAAEGREIKRLVHHALTTLSVEDYEDALEVAHDRLTTLVACVEALCERLQPEITEGGREV